MEINVIKNEKDHFLMDIDNQTIAELIRIYLNKDSGVDLAVWKKDHPDKPVVFELKTKGKSAKKALEDAVSVIEKESGKYLDEFRKALK